MEVYGGSDIETDAERHLQSMVALGVERTIEQDPAFAIRVMVDIAIRALSCRERPDDRGAGPRPSRRHGAAQRDDSPSRTGQLA
jgi:Predicted membrane protein (DUF2254)